MVSNLITNFFPKFSLGRKEALFGASNLKGDSVINTLLILARYFIFQQKFVSKELDEVNFINYVSKQLSLIYYCKSFKNKLLEFIKEWDVILDHFQVP